MTLTNTQYEAVMRAYERDRRKNREERERRTDEVYTKIPRYREIDLLIPEEAARAGKELIEGNRGALDTLKVRFTDAAAEKNKLLTEAGFPGDYLDTIYTCPLCQDTGYRGQTRCSCFEDKTRSLFVSSNDLTYLLQTNNFELMSDRFYEGEDLNRFHQALQCCTSFIDGFGQADACDNLLFFGPVGCGKSFLSIATAGKLLDRGADVRYYSAVRLFDELSSDAFEHTSLPKGTLMKDLISCDLLIIDDLATELTNAFVSTALFTLINERELKKNATIISTNLDLDELRARYSDRVFSRLARYYTICELSGRDIRLQQAL